MGRNATMSTVCRSLCRSAQVERTGRTYTALVFLGIDHVAVATSEFDETIAAYRRLLGCDYSLRERVETDGIEAAFFDVGTASIEILGSLNDHSRIAHFVEKRGTALHHVAFAVDDAQRTLDELAALG